MHLLLFVALLILSSCDVIDTWFIADTSNDPIPIADQRGFAGNPTDQAFVLSTFEHDDPTNILWWDGNIGIQQAGILSSRYSLFVNGVDAGVYAYIDSPSPTENFVIQFSASTGYDSHESNQYGIVFDYQDSATYGLFFINGDGQYVIGYFEDVIWYPLSEGKLSDVNISYRSFTMSMSITETVIYPLFNDIEIASIQIPQTITGHSGIYLGSRISDTASLLVEEFSINRNETQ